MSIIKSFKNYFAKKFFENCLFGDLDQKDSPIKGINILDVFLLQNALKKFQWSVYLTFWHIGCWYITWVARNFESNHRANNINEEMITTVINHITPFN